MSGFARTHEGSRAWTTWDLGLVKITSVLFGMIVGALAAPFVVEHLWWFMIPTLVLGTWSGYRWVTAWADPS